MLFVSLIIGGIGMIKSIPYKIGAALIIVGAGGILYVFGLSAYKSLKQRHSCEAMYVPATDMMRRYDVSLIELRQLLDQGLQGYKLNEETGDILCLSDRDILATEVWENPSESGLQHWLFKNQDIKKYKKKYT